MPNANANREESVTRTTGFTFGHYPALDGLRGLAILMVVPSNLHWGYPGGGFLGVDVFFVLSGFLITALLLAEQAQHQRIRLWNFYVRRALRLLPALVVLLAALFAFAFVSGSADVRHQTLVSNAYALLYVGNWYMAYGGETAQSVMGPLGPTWSLSVEEQFYLAWPLALIALLAMSVRWRRLALILVIAAIAASAWRSWLWFHDADWRRLYFGTDTRGASLLIGCALASLYASGDVMRVSVRVTRMLALAGVATLAAMLSFAQQNTGAMYAGGGYTFAALAAAAVILHLIRVPTGRLARVFSVRWLAWTGAVSYGIYLWHVPIAHVIEPADYPGQSRVLIEALRVVATMAAVVASYYVVERPFLRMKRRLAPG